jgi:hypothetical protein
MNDTTSGGDFNHLKLVDRSTETIGQPKMPPSRNVTFRLFTHLNTFTQIHPFKFIREIQLIIHTYYIIGRYL